MKSVLKMLVILHWIQLSKMSIDDIILTHLHYTVEQKIISSSVINIIGKYFLQQQPIEMVVDSNEDHKVVKKTDMIVSQILLYLMKTLKPTVMLIGGKSHHEIHDKIKLSGKRDKLVILTQNTTSLSKLLKNIHNLPSWNPRGKFIIFMWSKAATIEDVKIALEECWFYNVVNVVVLVAHQDECSVYSYFPFSSNHCGGVNEAVKINIWNDENLQQISNLFPNKLKNLKGCTLRVVTTNSPPHTIVTSVPNSDECELDGIEGQVIHTLAERMNFKMAAHIPKDGQRYGFELPNGSWVGATGDLFNNRADLAVCSFVPTMNKLGVFELSKCYFIDKLSWVLPADKVMPLWLNLLLPFSKEMWLFVGLVFLASLIYMLLHLQISVITKDNVLNDDPSSVAIFLWSSFFGIAITHMIRGYDVKIFFLLWLFYSLVITNAYQGSLVSFLTTPKYLRNINSQKELVESGIPFGSSISLHPMFNDPSDPVMMSIFRRNRVVPMDKLSTQLEKIVFKGEVFGLIHNHHYLLRYAKLLKGKKSFHIADESVMWYPLSVYMQKNSLYLDQINYWTPILFESGLIDKWKTDFTGKLADDNSHTDKVLEMSHMTAIFIVLFLGLGVGILIFIGETILKGQQLNLRWCNFGN